MSYRKLKADYLFDGYRMADKGTVLVCREDGTIEGILEETDAGTDFEIFPGMISPGFINCHCHLELSHLKGQIPEKKGLVDFVLSVLDHRNQPEEMKQEAMISAERDMLKSGIVAAGDICNGKDSMRLKMNSQLSYYHFIELLGWDPEQAALRFENGKKIAALFSALGDEKHVSLNPHAPYSVSDELWTYLKPGFRDKTITIHNQETAAESEYFKSGSGELIRMYSLMKIDSRHFKAPGISSLSYFLPKLKTASKILLVHNTFMEEADLTEALSFNEDLFFCFCPNANLFIEDRLPDIPLFLKHNSPVVLGTDSLASNHQLSILEEMKTIKKTFPETSTAKLLQWATSNGARALSFEDKLGEFSRGKKPGIVLIDHIRDGEIGANSESRRIL